MRDGERERELGRTEVEELGDKNESDREVSSVVYGMSSVSESTRKRDERDVQTKRKKKKFASTGKSSSSLPPSAGSVSSFSDEDSSPAPTVLLETTYSSSSTS